MTPSVSWAQGIQKWQTPDGGLYFGAKPPAGSTLIGEVDSLGTVSSPEMTSRESSPRIKTTEERKRERASREPVWKHGQSCGSYVSILGTTTKQFGVAGQSVNGRVKNTGRKPVRNVKVCAGNECSTASWQLEPGETGEFWLDTDHMIGRGTYSLTTECSIAD